MSDDVSDDIVGVNLWGEPVYRTARKRGRPPFEWTEENSHKVSMLLAMGWSNDRIAGVVLDPRTGKPISGPTLKRHFRSELSVRDKARDLLLSKQLLAASNEAFAGNVGAMRFLNQLIEKNDAALASARLTRDEQDDAASERRGKKAAAVAQAKSVVDEAENEVWGDDLKPGYAN